jgi:hypothetical protein
MNNMDTISYLGRSYGVDTDWTAVIREAARHPFGPSWLRADLDVASGLADLAEQLKGTPAEGLLAEAALSIVERGTSAERAAVWQLAWERGADAVERLLNVLQEERERLVELRGVPNVIWRLLQAYPNEPEVRAALQTEAGREPSDPWLLEMEANLGPVAGRE